MSRTMISVDRLGKEYRIAKAKRTRYKPTLRDTLTEAVVGPVRRARNLLRGEATGAAELDESFWALRDVSFEVGEGEVIGIIGKNGAGKSTLLKILSRITLPTTGSAEIRGAVSSLLEVGTGFHDELTGRENIYLNGAILGMRRQEIDSKLDEIIAFSEVERFIETPIKHYSSGMRLRLAFAVAAHLEPEIMIVDEVLAVGDAEFQRKCIGKMSEVSEQGRTVLFVSHNMGAVTQLCSRGILLLDGELKMDAPVTDVVTAYLLAGAQNSGEWANPTKRGSSTSEVRIDSLRLLADQGEVSAAVDFGRPFRVEVDFDVISPVRNMDIALQLIDAMGHVIFETTDLDSTGLAGQVRTPGRYRSTCTIPAQLLKPGHYFLTVVSVTNNVKIHDCHENALSFDVSFTGYTMHHPRPGLITPVLDWEVKEAEKAGQAA